MDHFDAFCYAHVVTLDYEVHTPDETPGILADTDDWGAVDAKSVDSLVVSCDRQYHFYNALFSWRSDVPADTPSLNNIYASS